MDRAPQYVEHCGDNLEQNENSVKTANASPSSTTSHTRWAATGIQYVQGLIDESMGLIIVQDIVNSCQHTQGFFQRALNLEDMEVGAWICILDTCIRIFLVQYSWFQLFCYHYFVIGYLFGFGCIAGLICNKMRSSEINLHYSEMHFWNWLELSEIHLETSEIDLNYLKFTWKFLKLTWKRCRRHTK